MANEEMWTGGLRDGSVGKTLGGKYADLTSGPQNPCKAVHSNKCL